ncbi:hypothetical protein ACH3XW_47615 [Acanthocheilonema viteae]|uniref:Uncharacterized protein n=1 Tax=Acanthocheilonema viteae TaxID=6277 RepID=A0A498SF25_ACAVI|nr:unnamed protein product [Acanthocheilonema viteae]
MSAENSTVSGVPDPNHSSGDSLLAGTPATAYVTVRASNEEKARNSGKDSESFLVGDTNLTAGQSGGAENRNTECNPTAPKADAPNRGRSLAKDNPGLRNRGSSPMSLTGAARLIAMRRGFIGYRRHPTPFPSKNRRRNKK